MAQPDDHRQDQDPLAYSRAREPVRVYILQAVKDSLFSFIPSTLR